jgi:glyoxylase-like metal-dependent hydrolase (beta-lactamase superfamily II)
MISFLRALCIAAILFGAPFALVRSDAHAEVIAPASGEVHPETLRALSEHVQVIPDNSARAVPNVGFVIGDDAVLVVDTGLGLQNGAAIAATAERLAPGKRIYIAITHAHPEHDLGAAAFPASSILIRSRAQQADLREFLPAASQLIASYSPAFAERIQSAPIRSADVLFDDEYILDLGGVTVRLIALGTNHTPGDTAVWVSEDRVLFAGDLAMTAQPVFATPSATLSHWLETLNRLEQLAPVAIVPSHGPLGDAGLIDGYRAYLIELRERTMTAAAHTPDLDAVIAEVTEAMALRYPDRRRIAAAVRIAYAEIVAGRAEEQPMHSH